MTMIWAKTRKHSKCSHKPSLLRNQYAINGEDTNCCPLQTIVKQSWTNQTRLNLIIFDDYIRNNGSNLIDPMLMSQTKLMDSKNATILLINYSIPWLLEHQDEQEWAQRWIGYDNSPSSHGDTQTSTRTTSIAMNGATVRNAKQRQHY